ncbi:MAG TPA: riboflavin synthase [Candidatus Omnitrophota bacterium]|nr:riboflavin synthase [Candidatus Omnitrophota bacterium]HPT06705.1 riboflavin synthase [Candidatus Omnitrophota bacterium]
MFSGIVEELGVVVGINRLARVTRLAIQASLVTEGTKIGDSISVNGVCLTVVSCESGTLAFDVMQETFLTTNLRALHLQEKVNLERALLLGERISGHFVLGHVDCAGIIRTKTYVGKDRSFTIAVPASYMHYVLPKGSVAVDGISLTIQSKTSTTFSIYLIPHTLRNTTFSFKGPSSLVNVEFDILAKR